ncbi:hypothetical protein [Phenylobacterium sp.]|uniref:hypothetical protein n=1 Tax=Phenylobacterium sp. TaxID=1871053 RepID=UPI00263784F3|nr:hypothetical protein [Phenylobacterium sp.]
MTESVLDQIDDILPAQPNGELVHWMQPRPLTMGPAGISIATAAAFAIGALTAVAALALLRWGWGRNGPRKAEQGS